MAEIGVIGSLWEEGVTFQMYLDSAIEHWRYKTFYSKEPETLAWIDSMKPGEVLYDIGANIGIYTLYAAARGIQVVAVEPVLENYMRLVQNIELNNFHKVIPIYGACGHHHDEEMFTALHIPDKTIGASGAQLTGTVGERTRTVPLYNLDDFSGALGLIADYIKVDVDGKEKDIILGSDLNCAKSILIEINLDLWHLYEAVSLMESLDFITDSKFNLMSPHSSDRRQKEGIKAVNMVFVKK